MRQTKTTITEYLAEGPSLCSRKGPLEKIQSQETEYEYNVLFLSQCQTSAMYMTNRAWFIRLYGEIIHELQRVDYRPYRRMYHALTHLWHDTQRRPCTLRVSHARVASWSSGYSGSITVQKDVARS